MQLRNLNLIDTSTISREEWLQKRKGFLGGSDMGTLLGINKYKSRVALFYEKLNLIPDNTKYNLAMYWGNRLEPVLLEDAQYLDIHTGDFLDNKVNGKKLRDISEFKYMVHNPDYPHFLANVDGLINFRKNKADGIAEAKTVSSANKAAYPTYHPTYFFQVQLYSAVLRPILRAKSNIIFYLIDGREIVGYEIIHDDDAVNTIVAASMEFGKRMADAVDEINLDPDRPVSDLIKAVKKYEPEPEYNSAYLKHLMNELEHSKPSDRVVRSTKTSNTGLLASEYMEGIKELKDVEGRVESLKSKLISEIVKGDANVHEFHGDNGSRITVKLSSNKRLYVTGE